LVGQIDELKAPAYVRHAYRHSVVGVGPPYITNEEGNEKSPAWSAMQLLDNSLEKEDWRRTYSNVARGRAPTLGPSTSIRSNLSKSASVPRFPQLGPRRPQVGQKKRRDSSASRVEQAPEVPHVEELSRELEIPEAGTGVPDAIEPRDLPQPPPSAEAPTENDSEAVSDSKDEKGKKKRTRVALRKSSDSEMMEEQRKKEEEEKKKKDAEAKSKAKAKGKSKSKAKAKDKGKDKKEKEPKKEEKEVPKVPPKSAHMPSVGTWFMPLPCQPLRTSVKVAVATEEELAARTYAAKAIKAVEEKVAMALLARDLGAHRPPSASSSIFEPSEILPADFASLGLADVEAPPNAPWLEEPFAPPAVHLPNHAPRGSAGGAGPAEDVEEPEPMPADEYASEEMLGAEALRCSNPPSRAPSGAISLDGIALASHAPSGVLEADGPGTPFASVQPLAEDFSMPGLSGAAGLPSRAGSCAPSAAMGSEPSLAPPSLAFPDPAQHQAPVSRELQVPSWAGSYASSDTREKQRSCLMTNSGATKQEVEIFAQSLTSSIFRATGKIVKRPAAPPATGPTSQFAATTGALGSAVKKEPAVGETRGSAQSPKRFKRAALPANESEAFF
jgi:hypothetical protein